LYYRTVELVLRLAEPAGADPTVSVVVGQQLHQARATLTALAPQLRADVEHGLRQLRWRRRPFPVRWLRRPPADPAGARPPLTAAPAPALSAGAPPLAETPAAPA